MEGGDELSTGFSLASVIHEPSRRRAGEGCSWACALCCRELWVFCSPEDSAYLGCPGYSCGSAVKCAADVHVGFCLGPGLPTWQQLGCRRSRVSMGRNPKRELEKEAPRLGADSSPSGCVSFAQKCSLKSVFCIWIRFQELGGIGLLQAPAAFGKCHGFPFPSPCAGFCAECRTEEAWLSSWKLTGYQGCERTSKSLAVEAQASVGLRRKRVNFSERNSQERWALELVLEGWIEFQG